MKVCLDKTCELRHNVFGVLIALGVFTVLERNEFIGEHVSDIKRFANLEVFRVIKVLRLNNARISFD